MPANAIDTAATTCPVQSRIGPPELPPSSAMSVWMERSPTALTTPAATAQSKRPSVCGPPITRWRAPTSEWASATTGIPTCTASQLAIGSGTPGSGEASSSIARSSSPAVLITLALRALPSGSTTRTPCPSRTSRNDVITWEASTTRKPDPTRVPDSTRTTDARARAYTLCAHADSVGAATSPLDVGVGGGVASAAGTSSSSDGAADATGGAGASSSEAVAASCASESEGTNVARASKEAAR